MLLAKAMLATIGVLQYRPLSLHRKTFLVQGIDVIFPRKAYQSGGLYNKTVRMLSVIMMSDVF
jgi:hypothetical protein